METAGQLQPGALFEGQYKIISLLGQGGMSSVYLAMDNKIDRKVAIKLLRYMDDDPTRQSFNRFQQEAKAISAIHHPNIVVAYRFATTKRLQSFLVLDYVDGISLEQLIKKEGAISSERATAIFVQICDALVCVHQAGIIHRDLKPGNIMLERGEDGSDLVRIVDFGIAKLQAQTQLKNTSTGQSLGSPMYMSPEQWRGRELDLRSDLYSFGCVMYEALCGKPPFLLEQLTSMIANKTDTKPGAFRNASPAAKISHELEHIVFKALQMSKEDRYQSAAEMLKELQALPELRRFRANPTGYSQTQTVKPKPLFIKRTVSLALLVFVLVLISCSDLARLGMAIVLVRVQGSFASGDDPRMFDCRKHLAESYEKCGYYQEAARELDRAFKTAEKTISLSPEARAGLYAELGDLYSHISGQSNLAQKNRHASFEIDMTQLLASKNKTATATTSSDALLERTRKDALKWFGEQSIEFSQICLLESEREKALGRETQNKSHYKTAREWLQKALAITEKKNKGVDLNIANSVAELGQLYSLEGDDKKAQKYLISALDLCDRRPAVGSPQWESALNVVETCAYDYGRVQKCGLSESLFKRIMLSRSMAKDPGAAETGRKLAMLYESEIGMDSKANVQLARMAEPYFQSYLDANKALRLDDEHLFGTLSSLARCQRIQEKYLEALKNYQYARKLCDRNGGVCQKYWYQANFAYADTLKLLGRYKEAAFSFGDILKFLDAQKELNRSNLALLILNQAACQRGLHNYPESERLCQKLRALIKELRIAHEATNESLKALESELDCVEDVVKTKK